MPYYDKDWSDTLEDCETSYWEDYLGGPDDDYFEYLSDNHEEQTD